MNPIFLKEHYDYFIYTLADLQELQTRINNGTESSGTRFLGGTTGYAGKKFKVMKDVDFNNIGWTGIGTWTGTQSTSKYFAGTFDGGGHKFINFSTINDTSNSNTSGLFIYLYNAMIRNFEVSGTNYITAATDVSLFSIGYGINNITKVVNSVDVSVNNTYASGVCMFNYGTLYIDDCYNFGDITERTGGNAVSGFIINNFGTCTVNRCINFGDMSSAIRSAAGIIALARTNSTITITNCANFGSITASTSYYRGGVFAYRYGTNGSITISKCYNIGNVQITSTKSGQIGGEIPNYYSDNYYDSTLYSGAYGVYNGTAKTTAELTDGSNLFSDTANWVYEAGYYPRINNWLKYDSRVLTALAV